MDDLDRRLRRAVASVPPTVATPDVRRDLLARLRHRRGRRLAVASGTAAVLLAGGVVAYGFLPAGHPARPEHSAAVRTGRAPDRSLVACAEVTVSGAPPACAGTYAGPELGISARQNTAYAASGAAASLEEVRVGQSIEVSIPGRRGLVWSVPRVSTATGPLSVARRVRSAAGRPAAGRPGGGARATFVAARQGTVVLQATARPACNCGGTAVTWSLQVVVKS